MKLSISTGGEQDYLQITAESLEDAANMVQNYQTVYFDTKERGALWAQGKTVYLRVYLGERRAKEHPTREVLEEIDTTA